MGHPAPLGRARVFEGVAVGLVGPLIHVASAMVLQTRFRGTGVRAPLNSDARLAVWALAGITLIPLAAALMVTHRQGDRPLWSAEGLARVLASSQAVQERRQPRADQPIRILDYVLDRRPADLKEGSYDWRTERYLHAVLKLGDAQVEGRPIAVTLDLIQASQHGLGYLCDAPTDGVLTPCRVADFNKDIKDDPQVIRVGLYQGESSIGRVGRTFLMSCRYSFGICKLEFVQPWYKGLRVALIFDRKEREHWADIVRFAMPEIERLIQRPR